MTTRYFNFDVVDPSWRACLKEALTKVDASYLEALYQHPLWLPGHEQIFNAFSLPVHQVKYVLFGESPYPRKQSANGYAFWDAAVTNLWSETGLSKTVNRATSLRNIIKMLLIAEGMLKPNHTTQMDIAKLDKHTLVQTNNAFFENFLREGFLLLNASLVLHPSTKVKQDAIAWYPFIKHALHFLLEKNPKTQFILFGQVANAVDQLIGLPGVPKLYAEHPYNISFIQNSSVLEFFGPLGLLKKFRAPSPPHQVRGRL